MNPITTFLGKAVTSRYAAWAITIAVLLLCWHLIGERAQLKDQVSAMNVSTAASIDNKANELSAELNRAEFREKIKDERISKLLDSLKIKPKSIVSYKYIQTEKHIHDTLTNIELFEADDYKQEFKYHTKCLSFTFDTRFENPVIDLNIHQSIYDITHSVRRKWLGIKFAPRIGKKEIFQTLVDSCGNTIRSNYKLSIK